MKTRVTLISIVRDMIDAGAEPDQIHAAAAKHGFKSKKSIDINISSVYRATGKRPRIDTKRQAPFATYALTLSRRAAESTSRAAKVREMSDVLLLRRLVEIVAREDMWNAILDDGVRTDE